MNVNRELPRFSKTDKRLLGTWKSDKSRTLAEWHWKRNTAPRRKKRLGSIFGKLEITYGRTRFVVAFRHDIWTRRYAVLASDDRSVAIVQYGPVEIKNRRSYDPLMLKFVDDLFPPKPKIEHIHFEKAHFWISLGNGKNREFFRNIRRRKLS